MKKILFLVLITHINLSAENEWSSPVAANDAYTLVAGSGNPLSYIYLNNSGTALTFFQKEDSSNSQILVTNSNNFGMTWAPPVQLNTTPSERYFIGSGDTFISLNQQGRAVFSWLDIDTATELMGTLKAALFDSSSMGWTVEPLDTLSFSMSSAKGNTTSVIGNDNRAVVSWIKQTSPTTFDLKSSFNTGSMWMEQLITSITTNMNATPSLFLSMSPSGEFLFASWTQENTSMSTKSLKVSSYDFTSGTWGSSTTLSSLVEDPRVSPVIVSDSGTAIAQWVEINSMNPKPLKNH